MKALKTIVKALVLSVLWNGHVHAAPTSNIDWLSQAVVKSQIIVVAQIVNIQPQQNTSASNDLFAHTGWSLLPPSLYTCHILRTLKGSCDPTIQVNLPRLVSLSYGQAAFRVKSGNRVLLLLHTNQTGKLEAIVQSVPLIKLSDQQRITNNLPNESLQSFVVRLLLDSLTDPTLRTANSTLLRRVTDPDIVAGLIRYINDPDPNTQNAVLGCLAAHQQVSVIPRIVQLAAQAKEHNSGDASWKTLSLGDFDTPEATSYLNPLIVNPIYSVRTNAIVSLRRNADQTSIPYLVLALRDSDYQRFIPSVAWRMLHTIVPALGSAFGKTDVFFYAHRETETKPIYDWWNDELSGKHVSRTPEGQQMLSRTLPADAPLAALNTSLFEPSSKLRRTAMYRLQKSADASSIPYLVLALQDPDGTVAYGAYETLHRLVPSLGEAQAAEAFGANQEAATKPVYAWWSDYLGGKPPVIPVPSERLIPLPNGK